jgi:hypothetical protein
VYLEFFWESKRRQHTIKNANLLQEKIIIPSWTLYMISHKFQISREMALAKNETKKNSGLLMNMATTNRISTIFRINKLLLNE